MSVATSFAVKELLVALPGVVSGFIVAKSTCTPAVIKKKEANKTIAGNPPPLPHHKLYSLILNLSQNKSDFYFKILINLKYFANSKFIFKNENGKDSLYGKVSFP